MEGEVAVPPVLQGCVCRGGRQAKIRLFPFGESEKLRFSAGDQWSPLRGCGDREMGASGWAEQLSGLDTGRRGRRPLHCESHTLYEFHTPSGSWRPVGKFCSVCPRGHPRKERKSVDDGIADFLFFALFTAYGRSCGDS